jgi:hypothetical protein
MKTQVATDMIIEAIGPLIHDAERAVWDARNAERRARLLARNDPDLVMAIAPYVNKLADMKTATEIRDFLVSEEIQAVPNVGDKCAVAEYVTSRSGYEVSVTYVSLACKDENSSLWLPHSEAMREFVRNFDLGKYPELVKNDG